MILRRVEVVGNDMSPREIEVFAGHITRVGELSSADVSRRGPLLDLHDSIVFPGLTNSHDHLEYNAYPALGHGRYSDYVEWSHDIQRRDADVISSLERVPRALRLRWGALKNLLCGVTTVAHHSDVRDDLSSLPIGTTKGTSIHSVRFGAHWRYRLNAPIGRPPYVFHIGEGTSRQARAEISALLRWNLLRRTLIGVHAIALRAEQGASFRAVVWCPLSNAFLYGATADVTSLKRRTKILFGTDSTLTADWNVWTHLRQARALRFLEERELFEAVTSVASMVWGRPATGRIAVGQVADLVVARKKACNLWDAFFAVDPEDILLVLRGGNVILYDASLDWPPPAGDFSAVRLGNGEKMVAEDVPALLAGIRQSGSHPNLPIALGPGAQIQLVRSRGRDSAIRS